MKTNFQALQVVREHYRNHKDEIKWGIINNREKLLIEKEFSLLEKDLIQLQDTRDAVVAFISNISLSEQINNGKEDFERWRSDNDLMSAITYAIDCNIINKGGRV